MWNIIFCVQKKNRGILPPVLPAIGLFALGGFHFADIVKIGAVVRDRNAYRRVLGIVDAPRGVAE